MVHIVDVDHGEVHDRGTTVSLEIVAPFLYLALFRRPPGLRAAACAPLLAPIRIAAHVKIVSLMTHAQLNSDQSFWRLATKNRARGCMVDDLSA
jgi:hypothetical protein